MIGSRMAVFWAVIAALLVSARSQASAAEGTAKSVILSTTTSTQDTGLLGVLMPRFEQHTGYAVKVISVGTGQATPARFLSTEFSLGLPWESSA